MDKSSHNRRGFLKLFGLASGSLALGRATSSAQEKQIKSLVDADISSRPSGSIYMGDYKAPKLSKVKIAFIGLNRGFTHVASTCALPEAEIVAVCDLHQDLVDRAIKRVKDKTGKDPKGYSKGPDDYLNLLKDCQPDAVVISTDWASHTPIACDCMNHGAHAFIEVPLTQSIDEIWKLIDTSEKTRKHCMMLENVNYGRDELMFLNMTRQGLIGDLTHGEAAYIHNLRDQLMEKERGEGVWRTGYMEQINGNLYPTHGLGPVAQYMNLGRGEDNFASLVSYSSPAVGRAYYAKEKLPSNDRWNQGKFICGDMNTSIIKTKLGRTIMLQWDETTPRPYSRLNLIQGTQGCLAGFPTRVAGEKFNNGNYHQWVEGEKIQSIYDQYDHPLWKRMGEKAVKMGGHGGMDFIMMARVIECLNKGEPLDQNIYEGAFWSAVGPLSAQSVAQDGQRINFPDFTRGDWKNTLPIPVIG